MKPNESQLRDDTKVSKDDSDTKAIFIGVGIAIVAFIAIFGFMALVKLAMWLIVLVILAGAAYIVRDTLNASGNPVDGWILASCLLFAAVVVWYFIPTSKQTPDRLGPFPEASIPALDETLAAKAPLPPEYRILCEHVAIELKSSRNDYRNNKGSAENIAEGHASVMALREIESDDSSIMYVSSQAQSAYADALVRLGRISALPKPQGVGSIFVESFIHGLYGNVYQGYAAGAEADKKQKAINSELQALMATADRADAAQMLLPAIAKKYAATPTSNDRVVVDIDESWGYYGPHDWFCMYNAGGQSLDDCTVEVLLTGKLGDTRKNVHFIPHWPAKSFVFGRYRPGETVLGRAETGRMTVALIQKAEVSIWSPTYTTKISYVYQGDEKDKDVANLCKNLAFSGRYQHYEPGVLWHTQPGLSCKLNGVALIPKCRVDVTFQNSSKSKSWYWEFDFWEQGDEKELTNTKEELDFVPEEIDMTVTFPDTNYRYVTSLTVAQ